MRGRTRSCLATLAALLCLTIVAVLAGFAFHCRRVMNAPVLAEARRGSSAYGCIGQALDSRRPRFRPEAPLARLYLRAKGLERPSPGWHFRFAVTIWAVEASTSAGEANRLYAASPVGRFRNFDHAAQALGGRTYCRLDPAGRQRVIDHAYSPSRFPLGGRTP
jgi:hypothetical protein